MPTDARIAQGAVETLRESAEAPGAVIQIAVETLVEIVPTVAYVAQAAAETAFEEPAVIVASVAQIAIETLTSLPSTTDPVAFVEVILDGDTDWTSLSDDLLSIAHLTVRRGIDGYGPLDIVASSGEATFALRNDAVNSGSTAGWYSPGHSNVRDGWRLGIPVRVNISNGVDIRTVFRGRIGRIKPEPGRYLKQGVFVTAYDHMDDLFRVDMRELDLGVSQFDADLFQAIYDAMPEAYRPPATNFDAAFDNYPYAFDDLGSGVKAAEAFRRVAQSGSALVFCAGDGTLTTKNRSTRSTVTASLTLDDTMQGLSVLTGTDKSYSRVRVTAHPKSVGSAPVVLYQETAVLSVFPGQTLTFWVTYQDPNDVRTVIGGADIIAPVANTDYTGDSLADGSGSDLTGNLVVTVTPFASTALVEIENTGGSDVYLVNNAGQPFFRIRGTPIYDDGERTYEASTTQIYGENPIDIDLPYQASAAVGQAFADFFSAEFAQPVPIEEVEFVAITDDLVTSAMTLEIGDRLTIAETATGANDDVVIQAVELEFDEHTILHCRYHVAPAPSGAAAPAPAPEDPDATDVIVSYTNGIISGTHNLTTSGALALTERNPSGATTYGLSFNRFGVDVRIKGVAAGQFGGFADELNQAGGPGGDSGASNITGVVVPLTEFNYEATIGDSTFNTTTSFRLPSSTIFLQLTATADVGAGGVDGSAGGIGMTLAPGTNGTSGVTGGGGGGGAGGLVPGPSSGGNGGDGTSQTGGAGGIGPDSNGAGPSPDGPGDATPSGGQNDGGGGGSGGGVLLGGIYAGGGGGGAGHADPYDLGQPAAGGQGVLTIELEP